ncbi:glycoside hydrolase family 47 protein [Lophiostoma macrostomum CBS 122681]|uniref:alpha-1,2-Mannosidase n=1 Tax=Lophiostoma macrostomum CBS 122681 TaxID=1314788 RepID=A0A6A6TQQ0_9PLEO|nr:glycoside hydrolase family 47 protein [Lophiostoma macrostomum CBS 122681]
MPSGVRINMPRGYQRGKPYSQRQQNRRIVRVLCIVVVCGLIYFWYRPIDILAVPFEKHEAYMNDRASVKGFIAKQSYDWRQAAFQNTIESYTPLPQGDPRSLPQIQFRFPEESPSRRASREKRRVAVRNEFKRSWQSYVKFAWTMDELLPVKGQGLESFGGWGATLVDSLDTLWIMGFKKEFYDAVEAVSRIDFGASEESTISVFETTIRYLGGLLSAYDLSHEKVLLDKAEQLGEMLYRAFDTPNNMPLDRLNIKSAKQPEGGGYPSDSSICFAGIGSLTMEFTRLAQVTGRSKYYDAVARVTEFLDRAQNTTKIPGLFPEWVNAADQDMSTDRTFTLGAMADSSYEYFPKMFALLGGLEPVYKKLYEETAPVIDKHMLFRPMLPDPKEGAELLFSGDVHANNYHESLDPEMQHLTCFIGGFFALAGRLFKNDYHVDLGAKLTEGCIYAYKTMPTGIMPEIFHMTPCPTRNSCPFNNTFWEEQVLKYTYSARPTDFTAMVSDMRLPKGWTSLRDKRYLLRPEAIESVFIMYRITGHEEYLDHAWDMFTAIQRASRTKFANGQVIDVTSSKGSAARNVEDKMESFWLAETLKYFYLIFSPTDMIDLDDWVFNTEAHPFRRPKAVRVEAGG